MGLETSAAPNTSSAQPITTPSLTTPVTTALPPPVPVSQNLTVEQVGTSLQEGANNRVSYKGADGVQRLRVSEIAEKDLTAGYVFDEKAESTGEAKHLGKVKKFVAFSDNQEEYDKQVAEAKAMLTTEFGGDAAKAEQYVFERSEVKSGEQAGYWIEDKKDVARYFISKDGDKIVVKDEHNNLYGSVTLQGNDQTISDLKANDFIRAKGVITKTAADGSVTTEEFDGSKFLLNGQSAIILNGTAPVAGAENLPAPASVPSASPATEAQPTSESPPVTAQPQPEPIAPVTPAEVAKPIEPTISAGKQFRLSLGEAVPNAEQEQKLLTELQAAIEIVNQTKSNNSGYTWVPGAVVLHDEANASIYGLKTGLLTKMYKVEGTLSDDYLVFQYHSGSDAGWKATYASGGYVATSAYPQSTTKLSGNKKFAFNKSSVNNFGSESAHVIFAAQKVGEILSQ
ncbi:MAG: hypothetical protein KBC84_01565 [Proteobacteria bacterium]|nr:hypothetical protein [Pseudomonadota bacterium]